MLLQVLYSIRSERQLMERVQYNLLFRWFIGLCMDDTVWMPTVFAKNRERLIKHDAVIEFFNEVLAIAGKKEWLSGEHFSVDGTLIQAWAGHKSFVRKNDDPGNGDGGNFKGGKRSNDTHQPKTDSDSRLYRKGNNTGSELRYIGHTGPAESCGEQCGGSDGCDSRGCSDYLLSVRANVAFVVFVVALWRDTGGIVMLMTIRSPRLILRVNSVSPAPLEQLGSTSVPSSSVGHGIAVRGNPSRINEEPVFYQMFLAGRRDPLDLLRPKIDTSTLRSQCQWVFH